MNTPLEAEAMQPTPVVMNTQGEIGDARQKDTENIKASVVVILGTWIRVHTAEERVIRQRVAVTWILILWLMTWTTARNRSYVAQRWCTMTVRHGPEVLEVLEVLALSSSARIACRSRPHALLV